MTPLIEGRGIVKRYSSRRGVGVLALDSVNVAVHPGELVGVVGESGSGKSTLSRVLVGIERPTAGQVLHNGATVQSPQEWAALRSDVQYIFQNPFASLAPHLTIGRSVGDFLDINKIGTKPERRDRVANALEMVGLKAADADSYPGVFSGGQRQRICIARVLVSEPKLIICDEIVSGLDVSVQAQILNLLVSLHEKSGVGLVFVSHDLRVVKYLCDRIVVMVSGQIIETGETESLFGSPQHAYTQQLLEAVPAGIEQFNGYLR